MNVINFGVLSQISSIRALMIFFKSLSIFFLFIGMSGCRGERGAPGANAASGSISMGNLACNAADVDLPLSTSFTNNTPYTLFLGTISPQEAYEPICTCYSYQLQANCYALSVDSTTVTPNSYVTIPVGLHTIYYQCSSTNSFNCAGADWTCLCAVGAYFGPGVGGVGYLTGLTGST